MAPPPPSDALGGGIMGDADDFKKADRLAARKARFNNRLEGNRYKEVRVRVGSPEVKRS
jgi:hypothetical protein